MILKSLTPEHFTVLQKYESQMKTAPLGYIRGLYNANTLELAQIGSHYGITLDNPNCGSCVLSICKQLSKLYFEYQQTNTQPPKLKTKKTKNSNGQQRKQNKYTTQK